MKTKRTLYGLAAVMAVVLLLPHLAMAAGADTNFGTTVTNSVNVQYSSGSSAMSATTSVNFVVDRVLDWVVSPTSATTLDVFEDTTGNAVAFSVRNDTNGPVDILITLAELTDTPSGGGPTLYLDEGNGTYDGTESALPSISATEWYLDEVAEDAAPTVFVVVDVAAGAATTDIYDYEIATTTREAGTGGSLGAALADDSAAPDDTSVVQNVYNDGSGYSDGDQDYNFTAYVAFRVVFANLTVTKTAQVTDDGLGGVAPTAKAIPGATVHYTITVTNTGTTAATNVNLSDAIPTYTTYVGGTMAVTGGGGASFDDSGDPLTVSNASIVGGSTMTVVFDVTID